MAATRRTVKSAPRHGFQETSLATWRAFHDQVARRSSYDTAVVWRGQSDPAWPLRPTLDRVLRHVVDVEVVESKNPLVRRMAALRNRPLEQKYREHLETFQYAARGRRGEHPNHALTENEWWALGQHFGLATPLLDWTTSPFVAAFFAFAKESVSDSTPRSVWALSTVGTVERSKAIAARHSGNDRPPIVEFIRPMSDDNPRLVSQGGLFTRGPDGVAIDEWVQSQFKGEIQRVVLTKYNIAGSERATCLRVLNRMNINHLSLFPDLIGASGYCNLGLAVDGYLPRLSSTGA